MNKLKFWQKPVYEERRLGFEVTMYIYQKSVIYEQPLRAANATKTRPQGVSSHRADSVTCAGQVMRKLSTLPSLCLAALLFSSATFADKDSSNKNIGGWRLSGYDRLNHADSSSVSRLSVSNVNDLKIGWIYNFPVIPFTPAIAITNPTVPSGTYPTRFNPNSGFPSNSINDPRLGFGASNGMAIDRNGRVYVPTFDGQLLVLDSKHTTGTNPDGTAIPNILLGMDFYGDPNYVLPGQIPGANIYNTRTFPTIIDNAVYAGNTQIGKAIAGAAPGTPFMQRGNDSPNPSNPGFINAGSVLYKLDRRTGKLIWKSVLDTNPFSSVAYTGITPVYGTTAGDLLIVPIGGSHSTAEGFMNATADPATDPFQGHCCDWRGGAAAIRISDGSLVWRTYSMPKQNFPTAQTAMSLGYVDAFTSGSSWGGGNIPYDKKLNMVYIGTSEMSTATKEANACQLALLNGAFPGAPPLMDGHCLNYVQGNPNPVTLCPAPPAAKTPGCYSFDDNVQESAANAATTVNSPSLPLPSSIMAMDATTGKIKWTRQLSAFDAWSPACLTGANSPWFCASNIIGSNYGFFFQFTRDRDAGTPILLENVKMADNTVHDVIVASGKGAVIYFLDAATGVDLHPTITVGGGGLFGDGFIWGLASDGINVYGNSGSTSDIVYGDLTAPGNPKKIIKESCIASGFGANPTPTASWGGGQYMAINVATGNVLWRRCAIGMQLPANGIASTQTPVADCSVANPPATCVAARANAPMSVSNGVLIATGASEYAPFAITSANLFVPEVLLLNASTGQLLRELPMGVPGFAAPNTMMSYSRAVSVGKKLFITTGIHFPDESVDPRAAFNRVIMYNLQSDSDDYSDDNDQDLLHQDHDY